MSGPGDRFTRREGADWLTDYFATAMPAAVKWFEEQHVADAAPEGEPFNPTPDGFLIPPAVTEQLTQVVKAASYIEVPNELLMDYGLIPDTRPPLPPTPWRYRLRNRVTAWRERAARRAYKIIAGNWPDDREDDW